MNIPDQISQFYDELESIKNFDRWELMKKLKPLTEMFDKHWNLILRTENMCLRFILINGSLNSDFLTVDEHGKEKGLPSIEDFSSEQLSYLEERAKEVQNPLLLARYNHLLYCIKKHRSYGIKAIKSYKTLVRINGTWEDNILPSIESIISLTLKLKFEINETKKDILELINDPERDISQKHSIFNLLTNSELFKSYELNFFPEIALSWINQTADNNVFLNKSILTNAIKICISNGLDTAVYYEKLAENELSVLSEHPSDSDFVKTHILSEIVEFYKRAKNISKYERYLKEYTHSKSQLELSGIDISPDDKSQILINEEINRNIKIILTWDLDSILLHYSTHSSLFPDIDKISESSKREFENSFLRYSTTCLFDLNNNVKVLSNDDNLQNNVYLSYQYSLGLGVLPEFIRFMQVGTYNRIISYNNIYDYFNRRTWLGQNIAETKIREADQNTTYTWLNLMAPALHSFFVQLESSFLINNKLTYTNWILPIDSLTLKFEGALREFLKIIGGNTSILRKNEIKEMLLDDLLNCDTANIVFSKDDLALFKMIFTNKGDNIRHNVAHGFLHPNNYNIENCCKIFLCILRLSKYTFASKEKK